MIVTAKTKVDGKWEDLPVPDKLTDRIEMLSELAGSSSVIKMETTRATRYFCGNSYLVERMKEQFKDSVPEPLVMECESAYNMIQYAPDTFFVSVEAFFGVADVKKVFPKAPKEGWEHLRGK